MNDQPRRRPAKPHRRPKKDPVRFLAFEALRAVDERDAYANLVLPPLLKKARAKGDFDGRDAALATELVYGTLRRQGTYDAIVAACIDRPLREVDPPVLDVLNMGVHQLLGTRIPTHAAVSASVELARVVLGEGRAKFVNAVLRKVSAHDLDGWVEKVAPPYDEDAEDHLAVVHSHPRWVVSALWDALGGGRAGIEDLLEADNERPEVTLVARPGRSTTEELVKALGDENALPGRWSPYAVRMAEGGEPGALTAVQEGRAGVLSLMICTVTFPVVARAMADGQREKARRRVERDLALAGMVVLLGTAVVLGYAPQIIEVLFQRGAFDVSDTEATAQVMRVYAAGLLGHCLVGALSRPFFSSTRPTWFPAFAMGTGLLVTMGAGYALTYRFGVDGIATANALGISTTALLLLMGLGTRVVPIRARAVAVSLGK
ncbi:rRNA cytosine-C5-methyltransferase [Streptomyces cavourensis]|nr:rRNA cytosine-C5-methyltransferase [Streptomyces cavourensis]